MNRSEPLTPEERALARLLGRTAPSAPSAALDEAVLAAARAAVQPQPVVGAVPATDAPATTPPRRQRRRARLPAVLGLAASVVFAVGIAWQLKPEPPQPPAQAEMAAVAVDAPPAGAAASPASAVSATAGNDAEMASAEAADRVAAPVAAPQAAAQKSVARPAPRIADAPRQPSPAVPAPVIVTPPAPPAPPAPAAAPMRSAPVPQALATDSAAPPLEVVTPTGASVLPSAQAKNRPSAPVAAESARSVSGAPGVMRRVPAASVAGSLSASAVQTAVDADAALPRRQWLQRIRERRDAGDRDTARASLERYLQHYPETRVPRDLRQLLDD